MRDSLRKETMLNPGRIYRIHPVGSARELARALVSKDLPLCSGFFFSGFLYLNDSQGKEGERKFAAMKVERFPAPGRHEVEQVKTLCVTAGQEESLLRLLEEIGEGEPLSRAVIRIDGPEHCCPLCA
jgi:hypothetical protein